MVGHEGKGDGAGEGDRGRELFGEEVEHGDGEGAKEEGEDAEVSFWFLEGVEEVGEDEEEWGVEVGWILLIELELGFEVITGVVEGVDLIYPEGFLVEAIEPECEAQKKAKDEDKDFFLFQMIHNSVK